MSAAITGPANTESSARVRASWSSRRASDQARTSARLRCRDGTRRCGERKSSRRSSRVSASSSAVVVSSCAAAISMASGNPSRRCTIRSTTASSGTVQGHGHVRGTAAKPMRAGRRSRGARLPTPARRRAPAAHGSWRVSAPRGRRPRCARLPAATASMTCSALSSTISTSRAPIPASDVN